MARNIYISQTVKSEQDLYENIIIESMKIYGQEVQYIPRELVAEDRIFGEDVVSAFDRAYQIEMYLENIDNFDGDQELFTKFGVEIRDRATLHVSRRRWHQAVGTYLPEHLRPREGDLIYLTLSNQVFEIMRVIDDQPFYQLSNLPTYRMEVELFEYNDENFDTSIEDIDDLEKLGNTVILNLANYDSDDFQIGEIIQQVTGSTTITAEIVDWNADSDKLYVAHIATPDGKFREFTTGSLTSQTTNITKTILSIGEQLQQVDAQNTDFETFGDDILDFSEANPFGEPT
jgi:hypothetical protein